MQKNQKKKRQRKNLKKKIEKRIKNKEMCNTWKKSKTNILRKRKYQKKMKTIHK